MEYMSACWKPGEEERVSLLLQQYQYGWGQIVFACVCGGRREDGRAGGYMTERCLTWFRGLNLKKLLKNREDSMSRLSQDLTEIIREADKEMEAGGVTEGRKTDFGAILCAEDAFMMLYRDMEVYLLNTAFGRAYLRRLEGSRKAGEICGSQGGLQPDIGLLIATKGFYGHITEEMIKESLFVGEIASEKQMERHLMELGKESGRRGGTGIGAAMIRTASRRDPDGLFERRPKG